MKSLCFVLLLIGCMGCRPEKETPTDPLATAVITGHIKNRDIYPRERSLKLIVPAFRNSQTIQECEIREDNTFSFRFQPLALRNVSIETFIPFILIRPGDSLHIELDFANLNKVDFSGTAGKLNQDLYAFTDGDGYYLRQHAGTDDYRLSPEAFKTKMRKEREISSQRVGEYVQAHQAEADLEKWIRTGMDVEYYTILLDYGTMHYLFTRDSVPDEYFDFDASIEALFDADVVHSGFFELASKYASRLPEQADTVENSAGMLKEVAGFAENKVLSQFMVASFFDANLGCNDVTFFEDNRDIFDQQVTLPLLREPLLQKYQDKKTYLTNPKIKSDAMLYGINPENGRSAIAGEGMIKLQEVVQKNIGKVTLINFWSGCPSALDGLDGMNQLSEIYKGEDVALVSISEDGKLIEKWARDHYLQGQKYFWTNQNIREIMRNWQVNWSPYYLLLNKEGVIVDYGTHLFPGTVSTKEKIDRLLEK